MINCKTYYSKDMLCLKKLDMKYLHNKGWNSKAVFLGAIGAFTLISIYFFKKRNQKCTGRSKSASPATDDHSIIQDRLNAERYVFTLPDEAGDIQAIVEAGGECYAVHLNGEYAGSIWQEENSGLQWSTHEAKLEPYLWEISAKLSEAFSRKGFPSLLMGAYPEILSTNWKTSETLEVILNAETDIEVFGTFLKDEVLNLVRFEEHLDLMVKKENDAYFIIVTIN